MRVTTSRSLLVGVTAPSWFRRTGLAALHRDDERCRCPPGVLNSLSVRTMYSTSPSRRIPLATLTFSAARRSLMIVERHLALAEQLLGQLDAELLLESALDLHGGDARRRLELPLELVLGVGAELEQVGVARRARCRRIGSNVGS